MFRIECFIEIASISNKYIKNSLAQNKNSLCNIKRREFRICCCCTGTDWMINISMKLASPAPTKISRPKIVSSARSWKCMSDESRDGKWMIRMLNESEQDMRETSPIEENRDIGMIFCAYKYVSGWVEHACDSFNIAISYPQQCDIWKIETAKDSMTGTFKQHTPAALAIACEHCERSTFLIQCDCRYGFIISFFSGALKIGSYIARQYQSWLHTIFEI